MRTWNCVFCLVGALAAMTSLAMDKAGFRVGSGRNELDVLAEGHEGGRRPEVPESRQVLHAAHFAGTPEGLCHGALVGLRAGWRGQRPGHHILSRNRKMFFGSMEIVRKAMEGKRVK